MRSLDSKLRKTVSRFLKEHGLMEAPLVVGVSGGPDSVCLLHLLAELRGELGLKLHVAHLNHSLRGAEAEAEARYVSRLAQRLEIPATLERREVRAHQTRHRLSLEEAAREVRYSFFAEVARIVKAKAVAVGHTSDDQVETILLHLVRGAGLAGLRGMPAVADRRSPEGAPLTVVRPLLEVARAETEAYCTAHRLRPRSDSSNRSPAYLRNRLRAELIPLLESYNPRFKEALLRAGRAAARDLSLLEEQVSHLWESVVTEEPERVVLDKEALSHLHPALQRHLLRAALERLLGAPRDIEAVHIESMAEASTKPAGKSLSLPGGLTFYVDYSFCTLGWEKAPGCPLPAFEGEHRLVVPGETRLPGWGVRATILEKAPRDVGSEGFKAYLDFAAAGSDLVARPRRRGDTFYPLGMEEPKKLQDFMVDAKIGRAWRDRVPLVCSPTQILWVVGWRIDHRARVTPSTRQVLALEFQRKRIKISKRPSRITPPMPALSQIKRRRIS